MVASTLGKPLACLAPTCACVKALLQPQSTALACSHFLAIGGFTNFTLLSSRISFSQTIISGSFPSPNCAPSDCAPVGCVHKRLAQSEDTSGRPSGATGRSASTRIMGDAHNAPSAQSVTRDQATSMSFHLAVDPCKVELKLQGLRSCYPY